MTNEQFQKAVRDGIYASMHRNKGQWPTVSQRALVIAEVQSQHRQEVEAERIASGSVVYFVQSGFDGPIKIGTTTGEVFARIAKMQAGNPETLRLLATTPGSTLRERELHRQFSSLRVRGEWFRAEPPVLGFIGGLAR